MDQEKIISFTTPKLIAEGLGFAESPLWHRDEFLIFSDVMNNKIMKLKDGTLEIFLEESGWKGELTQVHSDQPGSNGLAYDQYGNLIFCQHGSYSIARLYGKKTIEMIVDQYKGRRLNSPNDLCIAQDGSIYFTDPPYGIKGKKLQPSIAQPHAGVYRWDGETLDLLTTEFIYPNGICFSPDFKYLYISSNEPSEKKLRRYEVEEGKLHHGITFLKENADGIKTDKEGNLYLSTIKGILIFSDRGERIGSIPTSEMTTNLCIHERKLYITAPSKVYECEIEK